MSERTITVREAQTQLFLAWCALDSLKTQCVSTHPKSAERDRLGLTMTERIASIEASFAIIRDCLAQQAPDGAAR